MKGLSKIIYFIILALIFLGVLITSYSLLIDKQNGESFGFLENAFNNLKNSFNIFSKK